MSIPFAAVFPGQGSQSVGMLADLGGASPAVARTFETASSVLGFDLWSLVQQGPEDVLGKTDRTQAAMLTADVAVWRAWREAGGALPVVMAGHSLGEYAALVCAEALTLEDAVALVAERGRLMQEAVPPGRGAMAAILGLDDETVQAVCDRAAGEEVVEAVNFNSPGQVVVAGHAEAVARALEAARKAGARRAIALPVSVPSHCRLMAPAAEAMAARLAETPFSAPRIPVLHNADVAPHAGAAAIRDALTRQLHSPVRWSETVRRFIDDGAQAMIEFGPGRVLTGLGRRIDRSLAAACIDDPASLRAALELVGIDSKEGEQ